MRVQDESGGTQQLFIGSVLPESSSGRRTQSESNGLIVGLSSRLFPGMTDVNDQNYDALQSIFQQYDNSSHTVGARRKRRWYSRAWKAVKKAAVDVVHAVKKAACWYGRHSCSCIQYGQQCPDGNTCYSCFSNECQADASKTEDKCSICPNRAGCVLPSMSLQASGTSPNNPGQRRQDGQETASNMSRSDNLFSDGPDPWSLLIGQPGPFTAARRTGQQPSDDSSATPVVTLFAIPSGVASCLLNTATFPGTIELGPTSLGPGWASIANDTLASSAANQSSPVGAVWPVPGKATAAAQTVPYGNPTNRSCIEGELSIETEPGKWPCAGKQSLAQPLSIHHDISKLSIIELIAAIIDSLSPVFRFIRDLCPVLRQHEGGLPLCARALRCRRAMCNGGQRQHRQKRGT